MNERPPAMHYEAAAHADGYELEVLADLASHQFDDLDKYGAHGHHPEPAHAAASSWRRADAQAASTPGTCSCGRAFYMRDQLEGRGGGGEEEMASECQSKSSH